MLSWHTRRSSLDDGAAAVAGSTAAHTHTRVRTHTHTRVRTHTHTPVSIMDAYGLLYNVVHYIIAYIWRALFRVHRAILREGAAALSCFWKRRARLRAPKP
jgi:hypothetical protein